MKQSPSTVPISDDKQAILGVHVHNLSRDDIRQRLRHFLRSKKTHHVVTPNPEFIMAAQTDPVFRRILNDASLSVPDGFGLMAAARFMGQPLASRLPGTDLVDDLARLAAETQKSMYLLGGWQGTPGRAAHRLVTAYPGLQIVDAHPFESAAGHRYSDTDLLRRIQRKEPDILIVAHGAPKQELWLAHHLPQLPSVRIGIGVGGALDYIAGDVPRAPALMRQTGLEWLYRLVRQPHRWPRILTATVRFPLAVAADRFRGKKTV